MTNGDVGKILTDNGCLDIVMKDLQYLLTYKHTYVTLLFSTDPALNWH